MIIVAETHEHPLCWYCQNVEPTACPSCHGKGRHEKTILVYEDGSRESFLDGRKIQ
jgi:hypothetical protein